MKAPLAVLIFFVVFFAFVFLRSWIDGKANQRAREIAPDLLKNEIEKIKHLFLQKEKQIIDDYKKEYAQEIQKIKQTTAKKEQQLADDYKKLYSDLTNTALMEIRQKEAAITSREDELSQKEAAIQAREMELSQRIVEISAKESAVEKKRQSTKKHMQLHRETLQKLFEEKTIGFPWLAERYAAYRTAVYDKARDYLLSMRNPSAKRDDVVRELRERTKDAERARFMAEGLLNYYESLFPWLRDFRDAPDDIAVGAAVGHDNDGGGKDPAHKYVSDGEWESLPREERFQRALDRYWQRQKTRWEIGRDYERFIGYGYEMAGWDVTFFGAVKGFEDMGRDLVIKKGKRVQIVQCKNWAAEKIIHEKHIFQLFGTCVLYALDQKTETQAALSESMRHNSVSGVFVTSCTLSDVAKKCADCLGITVIEGKKLEPFPSIKCNIGKNGEKIYHLPFDQQYDKIKIEPDKGECYCTTVDEAEQAGFRRAFRWHAGA